MASLPARPAASALQNLLQQHPIPPNSPHEPHLHHLALQIAHNLRYQHGWSEVRLHYYSTSHLTSQSNGTAAAHAKPPLPRPLISGLPPQRLYVHPDEQIALLQQQKSEGKAGMPEVRAEREWVLPSHLREKWTLRRFGEVFDCVGKVPRVEEEGEGLFEDDDGDGSERQGHDDGDKTVGEGGDNVWRASQPKRLLLATLDDDSTVVYYIVHDGIVKPRQN